MTQYAINVRDMNSAIHYLFEVKGKRTAKKLDRYLSIIRTLENYCPEICDMKLVLLKHSRFLGIPKEFIRNLEKNTFDELGQIEEYIWKQVNKINHECYEINYRNIDENKSVYKYNNDEKDTIIIYNYPSYDLCV